MQMHVDPWVDLSYKSSLVYRGAPPEVDELISDFGRLICPKDQGSICSMIFGL